MKFPILFRIFAVLNVIAFLVCGISTLFLTTRPDMAGIALLWGQWAVTVWLAVACIAWFFASKHSYHFLYSLALVLMSLVGCWLYFIWVRQADQASSEKIVMSAIPALIFFYVIFLVVAMFYKPVLAWTQSRFSWKHLSIVVVFMGAIVSGLLAFSFATRQSKSFLVEVTFPDSKIDTKGQWAFIRGNESIKLDLENPEIINGLGLMIDKEDPNISQFGVARMIYSDSRKLDPNVAPSVIIEFKRKGNQLVAEFDNIRARKIQLFPLDANRNPASGDITYNVSGLAPVQFTSIFDKPEDYYSYVEEGGDADDEIYDEGNGRRISEATVMDFYRSFLVESYFSDVSEWRFDYSENVIHVNADGSQKIGMYKANLYDLYYYLGMAVRHFQEKEGSDFDLYMKELSGLDVFVSKAKGYEYAGNGTHFNYINPQIILWAESNLLPAPETAILGYSAQDYYNGCFKRILRLTTLSYLYLQQNGFQEEANLYWENAKYPDFYGPNYLHTRYGSLNFDANNSVNGWSNTYEFIGFWLRRKVDKTDEQCWSSLKRLMLKYDKDWFTEAEGKTVENIVIEYEDYYEGEGDGEEYDPGYSEEYQYVDDAQDEGE